MFSVQIMLLRYSFIHFIVYLYLYDLTPWQSNSIEAPVEHEEEIFECSGGYKGTCCSKDEFQCNNGKCIPISEVCDSPIYTVNTTINDKRKNSLKNDCDDGSDEIGCSVSPCSSREFHCPQNCFTLPGNKSRCSCLTGYTIHNDNNETICTDIDECKLGLHTCSQICTNTAGSYTCSCEKGYKKEKHLHRGRCRADDRNLLILFNSGSKIFGYDVEKDETRQLVQSGKVSSMDVDPITDTIYWWNEHRHSLSKSYIQPGNRGNRDTKGFEETLCISNHVNSRSRKNIEIDWFVRNLYWISNEKSDNETISRIMVSKLEGTTIKTLVYNTNSTITSFVLDIPNAKIYWTSTGRSAEIGTSFMNGVARRTYISLRGQHPKALTLDRGYNRLYWLDDKTSVIYASNKEGTKPTRIKKINEDRVPLSMEVFENDLYWVTKATGQLMRVDKFGRDKPEILLDDLHGDTSVKVYHKRKHKGISNTESQNLSRYCQQCKDFCIRVPFGSTCTHADSSEERDSDIICPGKELEHDKHSTDEPLKCNCLEHKKPCELFSPHHPCHCNNPCHDNDEEEQAYEKRIHYSNSNNRKTKFKPSSNNGIKILIGFIIFLILATCFIIPIVVQKQKEKRIKFIQMEDVR